MNLEEAKEALSMRYRGVHTVMVYAHPYQSLNQTSRFSRANQSVYLFPGTLNIDDSVLGYCTDTKVITIYNITQVRPVKIVQAYSDKFEEAERILHSAASFVEEMYSYIAGLDNQYYRVILANYIRDMQKKRLITEERQSVATAVIKKLQKDGSNSILEQILKMMNEYHILCKISRTISRRDKTVSEFLERSAIVPPTIPKQLKRIRENFQEVCKKSLIDYKQMGEIVRAKTVAQVMMITELNEHKEYFTFDEILIAFDKYRPDIVETTESSVLISNVRIGVEKLVRDEFVIQDLIMRTYQLAARCRILTLQLLTQDNEWARQ